MKYYEYLSDIIAQKNDDGTVVVYWDSFMNLSQVKFTAPKWYIEELMPMLNEVSKKRFDFCYSEEYLKNYKTIDLEKIDLDLFHGTDAKIVRMTESERKTHKTYCKRAIEYLYPLFKNKYYFDNSHFDVDKTKLDKETAYYINDCLQCYWSNLGGNGFYQYPDNVVYLSSLYEDAKKFGIRSILQDEKYR